jgi:hypothetical protein
MFAEFRAEVHDTLAASLNGTPLWDVLPDDVNELPCVVVGRPSGHQTKQAVVFDLDLQVFVVGRRQQAGASEDELTALADTVFAALGGTRGIRAPAGLSIAVTRVDPRLLTIAGNECPAYAVEVEASDTTC